MQARVPSLSGLYPIISKKLSRLRSYFDGSHLDQSWWEECDEEAICTTGLTLRLKFLGMKIVRSSLDIKGCMETFRSLDGGMGHYALMTITPERVHIIQYPWKLACDHAIVKISFSCTDPQNPRMFGYITRDMKSRNHLCVCFKAFKDSDVTGMRLLSAFDYAFTYDGDGGKTTQSSTAGVSLSDQEVAGFRYKRLSHYHSELHQCHTSEYFEDTTGSAANKPTSTEHNTVPHLESGLNARERRTGTMLRGLLKPRNYPPPPPPVQDKSSTRLHLEINSQIIQRSNSKK